MIDHQPARRTRVRFPAATPAREISGTTALAAIFGDPVAHSASPAMHNAAYRALGLDRRYVAFRVASEDLAAALRAIGGLNLLGVNLTVPHKEHAARLIRDLSSEARILGAVNCVVVRRGRLYGDNTDARGLERDLKSKRIVIAGKSIVIIGAGGAAAAATLAVLRMGAARVTIANRTIARARSLVRRLAVSGRHQTVLVTRGLDALKDRSLLGVAGCIINATSMGLTTRRFAPLDYSATGRTCVFYDLLYAAEPTPFLVPAIRLGRRTCDGAGMLVGQGELAFRLFNGVSAPADVMAKALARALGRK